MRKRQRIKIGFAKFQTPMLKLLQRVHACLLREQAMKLPA